MIRNVLLAAATAATAAALTGGTAQAAPDAPCVRTPGTIYHEVCVQRGDCLVYVWSTMPPAICV